MSGELGAVRRVEFARSMAGGDDPAALKLTRLDRIAVPSSEKGMNLLGKTVRLNRLFAKGDGRYLGLTVDHAMARGVMPGLADINKTLADFAAGGPDAITMHKGLAEKCFGPYAGKIPLVAKCSTFSPYQPDQDTTVCTVAEAIRLGADAVALGCIVGGDKQPQQIASLAAIADEAVGAGMPLIAHIYPRGLADPKDWYKTENVMYAARLGAELGVDIIKTNYTGNIESFARVAACCPARVVVAGGTPSERPEDCLQITHDVLEAGGIGITFGRTVFQYKCPSALIKALAKVVHDRVSVREAREYLAALVAESGASKA
jgi:DhnA family fructose-bisphosphate aldolase class Ia